MHIERPPRKKSPISITPLIDVVFLLLVFFMLASTFSRYSGFDLSGGRSGAVAQADISDLVLVRVRAGGAIDINGKQAKLEELQAQLQALSGDKGVKVAVKPLDGANVQDVVNVVEKARIEAVREVMVIK